MGNGWKWFNNGGQATYGYYDETWAPVIDDGQHSQLLEVNTFCRGGSDADCYSGIYQTVAVTPGETYELSMYGMLRALADDRIATTIATGCSTGWITAAAPIGGR